MINREKIRFLFNMIRASRWSEDGVAVGSGPRENKFLGQPVCLVGLVQLMGVSKKRFDLLHKAIENGCT